MNHEQEEALKKMAYAQAQTQAKAMTGGAMMADVGTAPAFDREAGRASIADDIAFRLQHARRTSREVDRLERLAYLLDKNPEILEILGLVRDLGLL